MELCLHLFICPHCLVVNEAQRKLYFTVRSVISDCRRDVDEMCALLGYYAASSGKGLPSGAASNPRRTKISFTVRLL
jgi:hypothetical protein